MDTSPATGTGLATVIPFPLDRVGRQPAVPERAAVADYWERVQRLADERRALLGGRARG